MSIGLSAKISARELSLWRREAQQAAVAAGVSPTEVDWLLQEVTGLGSWELRWPSWQARAPITLTQPLPALTQLWQQRLQERLPVQYLVGRTPWRHFSLKVSPAVLIPRPETECLIDIVLQAVRQGTQEDLGSGNWVDLGTGSGAIALGLAEVLTNATIYAVDCSEEALAIAQENASQLGFRERIHFYQGSWWSPLEALKGKVSGMVSNPPYIPTELVAQLQPEVANHEPHLALDGGKDGLRSIRHLIETAPAYLHPGGIWLIEMMAGQAEAVVQMLRQQGNYDNIEIIPDLAGIERFVLAYRWGNC